MYRMWHVAVGTPRCVRPSYRWMPRGSFNDVMSTSLVLWGGMQWMHITGCRCTTQTFAWRDGGRQSDTAVRKFNGWNSTEQDSNTITAKIIGVLESIKRRKGYETVWYKFNGHKIPQHSTVIDIPFISTVPVAMKCTDCARYSLGYWPFISSINRVVFRSFTGTGHTDYYYLQTYQAVCRHDYGLSWFKTSEQKVRTYAVIQRHNILCTSMLQSSHSAVFQGRIQVLQRSS